MSKRESRPSLAALFVGFASIGMMSFGGGLAAWIRRETVQKRGWLDDRQFLSGYALSQLIPGATNTNLAVFIGTMLRGVAGAFVCFTGLMAVPLAIILAAGAIYLRSEGTSGVLVLSAALTGMGAVGIGLNLGTGVRLFRRNIRRIAPAIITTIVALAIGVFGYKLLYVLAVTMPVSLLVAWLSGPDRRH